MHTAPNLLPHGRGSLEGVPPLFALLVRGNQIYEHTAMSATEKGEAGNYQTALRVVMMPRDTNNYGTIFGGVVLSYIDQAGYIEARKHGLHRWVTASIDRVDFRAPVMVGDVVSFLARTESTGTSSVKVSIRVEAERYISGENVLVTEAHMTMVAVDGKGKAIPFRSPPTVEASN